MTREEYMHTLEGCLYALSPEERAAAIQYYTEYFDDAGEENEQQVMEQLGLPQEVAKQILKDFSADRYPVSAYRPSGAGAGREKSAPCWWMVLIAVIALPVVLPLAVAIFAVLFGLLLTALILVAALAAVMIALILAGIVGTFGSLLHLCGWSLYPWQGWISVGTALLSLGMGILLLPLCFWIFRRGVPGAYRRIRGLLARDRKR